MVCSGFALYGEEAGTNGWAYQWTGWMIRLTGNDSLALYISGTGAGSMRFHYRLRHCACLYRYPGAL
ncbi:hypothetical protein KCP71_19430 [Salmonella enterica subsp. enterica]|nr:hypothetical protein KCP71_19430 [Salmonella enterica subsp. enterica]